jgi:heme-degrading monooxygenase HmoA
MFVAISRFTVANGMSSDVRDAFVRRPHLVDDAPGFIRLEVLNAQDATDEFWLLTYWTNEADFHTWHKNHRRGHACGIEAGAGKRRVALLQTHLRMKAKR